MVDKRQYNRCDSSQDRAYIDLAGKKEDYHLTDEEVTESYKKATIQVTQNTLNGLLDKEMIELQVAENGDMVYSLTENGKAYLEELRKEDEK